MSSCEKAGSARRASELSASLRLLIYVRITLGFGKLVILLLFS